MSRRGRAPRRSGSSLRLVMAALGAAVLVATGGCRDDSSSRAQPEREKEPAAAGSWRSLPSPPESDGGPKPDVGYSNLKGVRAGGQAVFIAGSSYNDDRVLGISYDPSARRWKTLPKVPLVSRNGGYTAVAGGGGVLVWGGGGARGLTNGGARFDLGRNSWARIAPAPLRARMYHTAVWTGRRMIVWGGTGRRRRAGRPEALADGAAYAPSRDAWRRIAPAPIAPRTDPVSVWTGERMLVWGGDLSGNPMDEERGTFAADGASYDPRRDRWRRIARAPIRPTSSTRAVWTGDRMLVWTGSAGASYDPASDRWRRLPRAPLRPRRFNFTAVWDGERMLIWGGLQGGCGGCADGASYDPEARRWRRLPRSPLAPRDRHAAVAIPGGMVVFGGCCGGPTNDRQFSRGRSSGARYFSRP